MDIKEFLLERVAEDEWAVRDVINRTHVSFIDGYRMAGQVARHDPTRVLRECAAKRAMIDFAEQAGMTDRTMESDGYGWEDTEGGMLKALAAVYSDHPDYQKEWKP